MKTTEELEEQIEKLKADIENDPFYKKFHLGNK